MRALLSYSVALVLSLALIGCGDAPSDDALNDNSANEDANRTVVLENVESDDATFDVVDVVSGLEHPWAVAFLPDDRMLITERPGRLNLVDADGTVEEVSGLPDIEAQNQGGLLDVVLHPEYEDNGWVYFTYSAPQDDGLTSTTIARAQLDGTTLADLETLHVQDPPHEPGRHYGSRLLFMDDGTFLATIGDRGLRDPAQDLEDESGSTLRLNDDGSVPEDNPFVGDDDAKDTIFSYGHRNQQGIDINPESGDVWAHEHGPRGGDELNIIQAGANYGWPEATYGTEYRDDSPIGIDPDEGDFVYPVLHWSPLSIAPSGMTFYTGDAFENWQNDIFVGALAKEHIHRVVLDGDEVVHQEELMNEEIGRIRDLRTGPDGFLYILNDESDGSLFRLEPSS